MEAEAYLLEGYGLRRLVEERHGHLPLQELAEISLPPRTTAVLVGSKFGTPFLTASQAFHQRPFPRKWLAEGKIPHSTELAVERGTILTTRSGTVGRTTLAFAAHESTLISDDLLRIRSHQNETWGWVYAYLCAPKSRAMMKSHQYGHVVKHLEVGHLNQLPVPPMSSERMADFASRANHVLDLRDRAYEAITKAENYFESCLGSPDFSLVQGENGFVVPSISILTNPQRRLDAARHEPIVSDLYNHFRQKATLQTLKDCGFEAWVPGRYKRVPVETGGVSFLDSSDLFRINPDTVKQLADGAFGDGYCGRVESGWILMASSGQVYGNIGGAVLATTCHIGKVLSNHVIRIKPSSNAAAKPGYVLMALTHPSLGRPLVKSLAHGSSVPELSPTDLEGLAIPRLAKSDEDFIADLVEESFSLHSRAGAIEGEIAFESERAIDHFIGGLVEKENLSALNTPPHLITEFDSLVNEWYRGRPRGVDIDRMVAQPAYQHIIALGRRAVPLILRELEQNPSHWFWALHSITGADPVSQNDQGNLGGMRMAWTSWGRQNGYHW